jgi:hypothetical protein
VVAQPVADHTVRVTGVLEFGDIGQAEDVLLVLRKHDDGGALDFNRGLLALESSYAAN